MASESAPLRKSQHPGQQLRLQGIRLERLLLALRGRQAPMSPRGRLDGQNLCESCPCCGRAAS